MTIYLLFGGNKVSSHESRKMAGIEQVTTNALRQDPEVLAAVEARIQANKERLGQLKD